MPSMKLLVGASALLLSSTTIAQSVTPVLDPSSSVEQIVSTATPSVSSSPSASLSSSISPSPSTVLQPLSCAEKDLGYTFSHTTSEGTYDITCGADYPGGDLKFLWADSFDSCVAACDTESACLTVAFRSGACYLKSDLTSAVTDGSVWAAKKHGAKAPDVGPTCVGKASDTATYESSTGSKFKIVCGKEYWGGDLTATSTTSFKECIETCATTSECVDVSYVDGACYLKRSKLTLADAGHVWTAELIDLTPTASTSSTVPTSSANPGKDLTCQEGKDDKKPYTAVNGGKYIVECGVDYFGNDLTAVDSSSFAACMDACDATDGCVDVSYVWGRCYLKASVTSSSPAGHVWTGRKTSAASDPEILTSLQEDGGSFCTSYISYKAPVTTTITTTTPAASTVASVKTEISTSTNLLTSYATATAIQTLPWLEPRQAIPTPSIVSGLPASRISSICSLVATGTSTVTSTATASVAPTTLVSTFTSVVPVTRVTRLTTFVTSSTRLPNPTAAVNLDFETGDMYAWSPINYREGFSNAISSPGHSRNGVTSKFAASMSKEAGSLGGYGWTGIAQATPDLKAGQTYRIEFSWKYTVDVDADDQCRTFVNFWGIGLANLMPSTTSPYLKDRQRHYLVTMSQCGTSLAWMPTLQQPQPPNEWRRYSTYFRAPYPDSYKGLSFGLHCDGGVQKAKQTVFFDDWSFTPVAAC
ncbi:hypothetical protein C7974DRAFT_181793 [Boeremia exigua]|uniref:uncharacterized protein n=1 Tax=Boeremia exigua TaxID=749465 RepID=UPI001E8EAEEF|nr:uncharacterized protein C7974DRAFT_181793 [Boeremia exigua]KAH6629129.1 hypothetical protein C7974DRAFT_181793 [Boeremia exigua]